MWKPEEMLFFQAFVLKREMTTVITNLAKLGVVHLLQSPSIAESEQLETLSNESSLIRDLTKKVDRLMTLLTIDLEEGQCDPENFHINTIIKEASEVIEEVEREVFKISDSLQDVESIREENKLLTNSIEELRTLKAEFKNLLEFSYVAIVKIPTERINRLKESLKDIPHFILPYRNDGKTAYLLIATMVEESETLKDALKRAYFIELKIPEEINELPDNAMLILADRDKEFNDKERSLKASLEDTKSKWATKLIRIYRELANSEQVLTWKHGLSATGRLVSISGYIPEDAQESVSTVVGENALIEFREPRKEDPKPPTVLKTPKFLKPFQGLLTTYGYPEYGHFDPCIFFTITYLFMFGVMFGDVGQGLILILFGFLLNSGRIKMLRGFQSTGFFLVGIGLSASVFGFLYGSLFGREDLIPALWISPMRDLEFFIIIGVSFGIIMISGGLIMRMLNLLQDKSYFEFFFDGYGLFSALMYWFIVGGAAFLFSGRTSLGYLFLVGAGISLALKVLVPLLAGKALGKDDIDYLETIFSVFEAILSYFTNSLSFARLSAFALAHGALGVAIYQIVDIVIALPMGSVWALIVAIIGNLFIILLEGMIVGIQALRLEFYELFSKFFSGSGIKYEPMKFKY